MAAYTDNVVDRYERPIPGVEVYIRNLDETLADIGENPTTTDADGFFSFDADGGNYILEFYLTGTLLRKDTILVGVAVLPEGSVVDALGTSPTAAPSQRAVRDGYAAGSGAALVGTALAATGAVTRTVSSKLSDTVSIADFSTPVLADANGGGNLFVPGAVTSAAANGGALNSNLWGVGQLQTADGNKRGKFFSSVKAAPSSLGNHDSVSTAFNGDLSHSFFQLEHRITGVATLGQPATGYVYTPEAYPFFAYLYNASGWNQGTADNIGRTAAAALRVKVDQYGQGDCVAYNATALVTGTRAGSTSFLANPAASLFNGDMTAATAGVYLNPRELSLSDGGVDVACIGDVVNFYRTVGTGAKGAWWGAYRVQSNGSVAIDNVVSAIGKATVGIDFSMSGLDFGTDKAAISLKSGDRIYFNNSALASGNIAADCRTTTFNGDYITHDNSLPGILFVAGGTGAFQVGGGQVTITAVPLVATQLIRFPALAAGASYANDAAAAAGGVPVGQLYRNGSVVQIRVV